MKKIALACTGGGVKACANIGVLRALKELGFEIEAISGASLGGLVALLHALNYTPEQMLEMFKDEVINFEKFSLIDVITSFPRLVVFGGAKNPKNIINFVNKLQNKENIKLMEDIEMPIIIPSLDISKREVVYYSSKQLDVNEKQYRDRNIAEAIRSSCALPIMFTPNKVNIHGENHFMLDGGILTNTLVTPLKQFSDCVIGVTSKFHPKQRKRVNMFTGGTQTFQSMRRSFLSKEKLAANYWIEFDTGSDKFVGGC